MLREDFATVIGTLAVATNKILDAETVEVYFAALCDVPTEMFKAGATRLINGNKWFPSVGELRASCDRVRDGKFASFSLPQLPANVTPLRDDDPRLWYACVTCQDSGWASHWCKGSVNAEPPQPEMFQSIGSCGSSACARFGAKGYGHEHVKRCPCYATNPTIKARLDARRTYATEER